jgi:hypothetical protein
MVEHPLDLGRDKKVASRRTNSFLSQKSLISTADLSVEFERKPVRGTEVGDINRKGRFDRCWVIDPLHTTWLNWWDLWTTTALVYTAVVTPVEVSFLPSMDTWADRMVSGLFWTNRTVDVTFIIDMLLQFRTAVLLADSNGTRWLRQPRLIAKHYMTSRWFWIDLFSVSTSAFDLVEGGDTKDLTVLRAVRVLRLAKLIRLARGSRIFKKWELRMSINYAYLSLVSLTLLILVVVHWFACVWGLQASFYPLNSWLSYTGYCVPWGDPSREVAMTMACPPPGEDFEQLVVCDIGQCVDDVCSGGTACADAFSKYTYSLYFAIMTITSVGCAAACTTLRPSTASPSS